MKTTPFFLSVLFMLFSCTKDKETETQDQLPPITTIGANTAGCIINGKVLIPKNGSQTFGGPALLGLNISAGINFNAPIIGDDYWQLEIANKRDVNGAGVILWIKNMTAGNADYIVGQSNGELYSDGPNNNQMIAGIKENGIYKTFWSGSNSGIIQITRFDYFNGIYSGTFNGILYNKYIPTEKIQITDGRFDIKISTLNK